MSLCVSFVDGVLKQSSSVDCNYILMSQEQVSQLVNSQFDYSLLQFDQSMYEFFIAQSLIAFIVGHSLGRVIKYFGKR